jgi:hypothetical protein
MMRKTRCAKTGLLWLKQQIPGDRENYSACNCMFRNRRNKTGVEKTAPKWREIENQMYGARGGVTPLPVASTEYGKEKHRKKFEGFYLTSSFFKDSIWFLSDEYALSIFEAWPIFPLVSEKKPIFS